MVGTYASCYLSGLDRPTHCVKNDVNFSSYRQEDVKNHIGFRLRVQIVEYRIRNIFRKVNTELFFFNCITEPHILRKDQTLKKQCKNKCIIYRHIYQGDEI